MTDTRAASQIRREQLIWKAYWEYVRAANEVYIAMPNLASAVTWASIMACRRALEQATVALDAIEVQMPAEGRR